MEGNAEIKYYEDILWPIIFDLSVTLISAIIIVIYFVYYYKIGVRIPINYMIYVLFMIPLLILRKTYITWKNFKYKIAVDRNGKIMIPGVNKYSEYDFKPNTYIVDNTKKLESRLYIYFIDKKNIKMIKIITRKEKGSTYQREDYYSRNTRKMVYMRFIKPLKCQKIKQETWFKTLIFGEKPSEEDVIEQIYLTLKEPEQFIRDIDIK